MASAASSRTGLITATVAMSIVAVSSLIFAAIFAASATKSEKAAADLAKKYGDVTRDPVGPTATAIRTRRDMEGSPYQKSDSYLDVTYRDTSALSKLIAGQEDVSTAQTAAKTALQAADAAMKQAKLGNVNTEENMSQTIMGLSNAVTNLTAQVQDLIKAAADAKASSADVIKSTQEAIEIKNKEIADYQKQIADAANKLQEGMRGINGVTDANAKTIEEQARQYSESNSKLDARANDAERNYAQIQKENKKLQAKLATFRPDPAQSLIRQPDGYISKLNTDGSVYISLGAGQQITPGMTFEVYDRVTGVPAMKADDSALPKGKGSLEVLVVGANTSECRILTETAGRTISQGDIIANLIYDRNTHLKFVVYGRFDLTKPGTPDAADAGILKRLVAEWGATVQPELTVDTDFLIVGAEPKVPDFSDEQRRDPVNAKTLADAQADVDAYRAVVAKAVDMSVPVVNQNRFLYYIGYFDKAKR